MCKIYQYYLRFKIINKGGPINSMFFKKDPKFNVIYSFLYLRVPTKILSESIFNKIKIIQDLCNKQNFVESGSGSSKFGLRNYVNHIE